MSKTTRAKRTDRAPSSKCKALNSNPSAAKTIAKTLKKPQFFGGITDIKNCTY
jgi:hypothetical protein